MKNYKIITISSIFLLLIIVAMPNILSEESVKTIYVDDDGAADYISIQDAIDNASDGDTVFVYSGIYYENIIVDKSIILIGEDKNTTIIDGSDNGDVFDVSADRVHISSFTIQNSGDSLGDAGLDIQRSDYISITNNIITDYYTCYKIYLHNSNNNTISGNTITNTGYGIYFDSSNNNVISGNFINNSTTGIYLNSFSDNNTISGNKISNGNGIELFLDANDNVISGNTIINSITGIEVWGSNNNILSGNTISNSSFYGLHVDYSNNNVIYGNIINNSYDGIYFDFSSNNTIYGNTISNSSDKSICIYYSSYYSSSNNIIYHNNFINNNQNANVTENNTWYNQTLEQGNYWDDYNGTDKNNDGIGDIPYNISGERCQDLYPLMSPYYGRIVIKDFYVDQDAVIYMLWIAMIATIIFLMPIAYIWYRKTRPRE